MHGPALDNYITGHFGASVSAVRATMARHGDTIAPGDVFLANDPHNGGGLHPNDVIVQKPAFAEGKLIGWVAVMAILINRSYLQASTRLATDLGRYGSALANRALEGAPSFRALAAVHAVTTLVFGAALAVVRWGDSDDPDEP